jgi:hypothetical protein
MDSAAPGSSAPKKSAQKTPAVAEPTNRRKEPKTSGVTLTIQQPLWKWEERFQHARVGDFAQYDLPDEHLTRIQEVVEVGERFIVVRERILPTNNQKVILMKFDDSTADRPTLPEPETIKVKISGKDVVCKRYVYPAAEGRKGLQEVYSDEVPFDGLVGRQSDKGSLHLRRYSRGRG